MEEDYDDDFDSVDPRDFEAIISALNCYPEDIEDSDKEDKDEESEMSL